MRRSSVLVAAALAACLSVGPGCSNKVSVEEGKARIQELSSRGVPERQMSDLKMYLFNMETAQKTGNSKQYNLYRDSLTVALAAFEVKMEEQLKNADEFMKTTMAAADAKMATLKGLHLAEAQKLRGPVDSVRQIESQKLDARNRVEAFAAEVDTLAMQQVVADSMRGAFVGIWVTGKKGGEGKFTMEEQTEYYVRADGSLFKKQWKKGQLSAEDGKEDWLFESRGSWDVKGDDIYFYVNKEKRVRQIFEGIDPATGKWRKKAEAPYDSTVNRGAEFISWAELNKEYEKFPIK